LLAKTLRLESAELTDVGRRRERNQDNVAHLIPSDTRVLDEKGALFIVCDGMGGHAAGEVASELGVKTIRDEYYSNEHHDVISSIASAVERANATIYQHAAEHPELSGMGTTCVALVIADGRAFVINIGDSRAYIIRNGKMRQVTRDHSWVAEQVRVGLLTEEQARTHSHRNVITRSLGTQPNVTADLFIETMHDGDRILLCSDGLHGYVEESEIEQVVTSDVEADAAVQQLIDMANNNGGPDNITASLVHLVNVPAPTGALALPDSAIPAEGITQPLPAVGARATAKSNQTGKVARVATPVARRQAQPRRAAGSGWLTNSLRVLVVVLIIAVAGGFWYFSFGPYGQEQAANQQLRNDVAQAQQTITHAPSQDPAAALTSLAQARDRLVNDLANSHLDASYRTQGEIVLSNQLQPAVQQAIQRYNSAALVTPVNIGTAQFYQLQCQTGATTASLTSVSQLAVMNPRAGTIASSPQIVYLVDAGRLYQVQVPLDGKGMPQSGAGCTQIALNGVASVVALAGDGMALNVLAVDPSGKYLVMMLTTSGADAAGNPRATVTTRFTVAAASGVAPGLIAASGADVYISFSSSSGAYGVWHYSAPLAATALPHSKTPPPPAPPKGPSQTILLQRQPISLAYAHSSLYMLDAAGGLGQIDAADKFTFSALPVQILSPLRPASPNDYTVAAPVPTPMPTPTSSGTQAPGGALRAAVPHVAVAATATPGAAATATPIPATSSVASGTLFGKAGALAIDPAFPSHLLICDPSENRLVRLVASESGPGLGFAAQYAYGPPLQGATQVAVSSAGSQLVVYTWANSELAAYTVPETGAGA
jgi:serine/threonine protein phosphatase PrpC